MNHREVEDQVTDERRVSVGLASLREAYSREQAGPSVEEQLLVQFSLASNQAGRKRMPASAYWALAAAALLLSCGLVLWLAHRPVIEPKPIAQGPADPPSIRAGSVTAAGGSDRIVSPSAEIAAAPAPPQPKKTHHRGGTSPAHSARPSEKPQPRPFIATMIPTATDADYGLQLVRVELPRRTMMSFGLPVDSRQLNTPVKADLIIGPDGLTRAIRFVQE